MKVLLKILSSPIGMALVVVHWTVVAFALWGDVLEPGFKQTSYLLYYLSVLNAPALLVAKSLSECVAFVTNFAFSKELFFVHVIFCVTLQLQLVGFSIKLLIKEIEKSNHYLTVKVFQK